MLRQPVGLGVETVDVDLRAVGRRVFCGVGVDGNEIVGAPVVGFLHPLAQAGGVAGTQDRVLRGAGEADVKTAVLTQHPGQIPAHGVGDVLLLLAVPRGTGVGIAGGVVALIDINFDGHKHRSFTHHCMQAAEKVL